MQISSIILDDRRRTDKGAIVMEDKKTKTLVMTALMAAIVFVATYLIKIPNPATGGYSHMGDCMIFLAVLVLQYGFYQRW